MTVSPLAADLAAARARAAAIDPAPWRDAIADVSGAYRVQSELAQLAGGPSPHGAVYAWKVTALTPAQQQGFRSGKPVAGALLAPFCHAAPATVALSAFVVPLLECEIAFLLGRDLPLRETPYERTEIVAAVTAIVPVLEIADCRWTAGAPDLLKLADDMGNGAFITGKAISGWSGIDLGQVSIALAHDGSIVESGNAAKILGDPLAAVQALANAQPLPAGGLRRGQIVTTGTCTTPTPLRRGSYTADFGLLGTVTLAVV